MSGIAIVRANRLVGFDPAVSEAIAMLAISAGGARVGFDRHPTLVSAVAFDAVGWDRAGSGISRPTVGQAGIDRGGESLERVFVTMFGGVTASFSDYFLRGSIESVPAL